MWKNTAHASEEETPLAVLASARHFGAKLSAQEMGNLLAPPEPRLQTAQTRRLRRDRQQLRPKGSGGVS